ncbi:hypothetical protein BGZ58_006111, partial [Dissophora ornata]
SPPSTSNLPSTAQRLDVDVSSPTREFLKAKIEFVKNVMIDLELQKMKKDVPNKVPPPTGSSCVSDDVYIAWCRALNNYQYGDNLFVLIEELRGAEEKERKTLRSQKNYAYENEDSPHRRHLRVKIDAIKQAICDHYLQMKSSSERPNLPADPYAMDINVFLVWRLHDSPFKVYSAQREKRYPQGSIYNTYTTELGCVIVDLQAADEEERQYLVRS